MRCRTLILLACIAIFLGSCSRIEYIQPDDAIPLSSPLVLAHGATGNSDHKKNSLEGVKYGLSILDGVEIDIVMSKNGTLWLSHDTEVKTLDKNFIKAADSEITKVLDDDNLPYYDKLEDVLEYISDSSQTSFISLDYKYSVGTFTGGHFKSSATKINELVSAYNLNNQVAVECDMLFFLSQIHELNPEIETYYLCLGNFEKGIAKSHDRDLTGISFDYGREDSLTTESISLAHELGLKVLTYTINDDEIKTVHRINPDIIQTDNMDYYDILNN